MRSCSSHLVMRKNLGVDELAQTFAPMLLHFLVGLQEQSQAFQASVRPTLLQGATSSFPTYMSIHHPEKSLQPNMSNHA